MSSPQDLKAILPDLGRLPPPGTPQGVAVPDSALPNRTPVYRHWRLATHGPLKTLNPEHTTTHDLFEDVCKRVPNLPALGMRPWNRDARRWENSYAWLTFKEVAERRRNLGVGLVEIMQGLGFDPSSKYGVGLWSQNRPEWQIAELAIVSQSLFSVSLYETLGPETSEYIINHAEIPVIMCSLPRIPALLSIASRIPQLKVIISMDPLDSGEPEDFTMLSVLNTIAKKHGITIYSITDVEAIGAQSARPMRPPTADDMLTINYTSGTTGNPKGVVLTHSNAVAALTAARGPGVVKTGDCHISYLPLAHIYGRMADQVSLFEGARVGYFCGDITTLVDDIKLLRPSSFFGVPRLYNRFNSALRPATVEAPGLKGALSRKAIDAKRTAMKLPLGQAHNKHFLFDRIWTPKVTAALGFSRCGYLVSGSAQLDPKVQQFLRAALGQTFVQGYGLTESYSVGIVQLPGDFSVGNIGCPTSCVEVCLESVPDMEYLVTDKPHPRGELLLRGPAMFQRYHKDPEETAKAIDSNGWFHTGDIARVDDLGRFSIVDRKKNVLKLSQGEYISPERLENVYTASTPLITTAFVHGDPIESTLVGIFGIDPVTFAPFASSLLKRKITPTDSAGLKAACQDPVVRKEFLKILNKIGTKNRFNRFEMVRAVHLDLEPFTMENELLTPTLKLKRQQAAKAFKSQIERMYAEINEATVKAKL